MIRYKPWTTMIETVWSPKIVTTKQLVREAKMWNNYCSSIDLNKHCFQRCLVSGAQITQLFPMSLEMLLAQFQHQKCIQSLLVSWRSLWYDAGTGLWWLCYQEKSGMYWLLCRKHNTRYYTRNKSKVWKDQPSMRLHKVAITDHSTTEQQKNSVTAKLLQRI